MENKIRSCDLQLKYVFNNTMSRNERKNKQEVNEVLLQFTKESVCKQTLYNRCKSIVDHDEWYTELQRRQIYQEALKCTFFSKKLISIFKYYKL